MPKEQITKIFNRQTGKILTFLDKELASDLLKQTVKNQLWLCHDDIQEVIKASEEKKDEGNKFNIKR